MGAPLQHLHERCARRTGIAWASPAVDPASGNVIAISANGLLMALSPAGKLLWERSLAEEVGMWTTHGGRMSSPIIDGNQVIVSGLTFSWGQYAGGAHRFMSFDKTNGQTLWISAPEGRPTDTIYANPFIATVNGTRMFFSGGSDGAMHALKVATGEPVWNWLVSKRGLNTAALVVGDDLIVSHSEENIISNEMGMLAAVPAASTGMLSDKGARWLLRGVQAGYASPVSDGERIYVLDNGGVLFAFDLKSGKELWKESIGTIAKASPVLADGKLYLGTENTGDAGGKFYIVRPHADKAEILDQDWLGTPQKSEQIIASPIVARGRIYVASMDALYAIGPKSAPAASKAAAPAADAAPAAAAGPATVLTVAPTELILKPGQSVALTVRAFDAKGNAVANPGAATWALENLKGTVADGKFTADERRRRAGRASSRRRSVRSRPRPASGSFPICPWTFDFEDGARDAAAAVGQRHRQVRGPRCRRQQGAREARREPVRVRQALPAVHGRDRPERLHHPGRRARPRQAPPDGRHRHRRAALRAGAVRQSPAPRAAAVAAGGAAHGQGRLQVEPERLVHDEAGSADRWAAAGCVRAARSGRRARPSRRPGQSSASIRLAA